MNVQYIDQHNSGKNPPFYHNWLLTLSGTNRIIYRGLPNISRRSVKLAKKEEWEFTQSY